MENAIHLRNYEIVQQQQQQQQKSFSLRSFVLDV
jgi:hypothetical protein